jgi:chromosome partitioning protein
VSPPIIAFCNARRGVGTTTLVYNLAYMFSDLGVTALMADLDPQINLSVRSLGSEHVKFQLSEGRVTVYDRIEGTIPASPSPYGPVPPLRMGDPRLSEFDYDTRRSLTDLTSRLDKALREDANACGATVVLADLAPNLGALNHAILLCAEYLVVPTAPGFLSVRGTRVLGKALRQWEDGPSGHAVACPLGYVVGPGRYDLGPRESLQAEFHSAVLRSEPSDSPKSVYDDPYYLGGIHPYPSLADMATDVGKPMFHLTEADGAMGSHFVAMQSARKDFEEVARRIAGRAGLKLPQLSGA